MPEPGEVTPGCATASAACERRRTTRALRYGNSWRQGNTVVVLLHVVAKARSTGKTFESDIVHFFTIRDARIASSLDFFDTAALVDANRV